MHKQLTGICLYVTEDKIGLRDKDTAEEWEIDRREGDGSDDLESGDEFILWAVPDDSDDSDDKRHLN